MDFRCQEAQVLGDDLQLGEPSGEHPDQVHARPFDPSALLGGHGVRRNCPIALQAPEMVDAHHVKEAAAPSIPPDPPAEAILFHGVPIVKGVAPQLPLGAEVIRGHAGHRRGPVVFIQLEPLWLRQTSAESMAT